MRQLDELRSRGSIDEHARVWLGSWQRFCARRLEETYLMLSPLSERNTMIYEAQRREIISDSLKIGCVIAGMGHSSMKEHLLLSATKCDNWTNFARGVQSMSMQRKPSMHRRRWNLAHFKVTATSAGNMDTLRKSVGIRAMVQKSRSVRHGATRHPTKTHRKEDGKVQKRKRQGNPEGRPVQKRKRRKPSERKR